MNPAPYFLLIDVGNTFAKWGLYQNNLAGIKPSTKPVAVASRIDASRVDGGRCLLDEIPTLVPVFAGFERAPRRICISNVAGTKVRNPLLRSVDVWQGQSPIHWTTAMTVQCGVRNGYRNPSQLGSDRWAALIGAHARYPNQAVLVVTCGTATTIDLLAPDGLFMGGNILPGMGLMLRSLHLSTAALPDADGDYVNHPDHTLDAITSGCQHAQAGAIERLFRRHRAEFIDLLCLVSGGAGKIVASRLTIPYETCDHLVTDGLYHLAQAFDQEK